MIIKHDGLSVCVDCLTFIANGDDTDGVAARIAEQWGDDARHLVPACPEECEGWFSWSPCDGCGSTLGGERHPAAVLAPEPA